MISPIVKQIAITSDRIQNQARWISEGIATSEWKYISQTHDPKDAEQYLSSLKEIHFHIESILNYVNQLSEDEGVPILNEC